MVNLVARQPVIALMFMSLVLVGSGDDELVKP